MNEADSAAFRRFTHGFIAVVLAVAMLPWLIGQMAQPPGGLYLGAQYNTDDHMVYAAWMKQAMEGRFFFENRFTTDAQPALTVHLYFWVLGQVARVFGLIITVAIARIVFGALLLSALAQLIRRAEVDIFTAKVAMILATFGGGLGFLVWQNFGLLVAPESPIRAGFGGRLPIDVWQPEAFVFPSLLTNSLFLVSGWLILAFFNCVLDARSKASAIWPGMAAIGLLMNIHSYDVLLVGLVLVAFAVASWRSGHLTTAWLTRVVAMLVGVVPAAAWFWHVLSRDAVFQARAATPTFSPPLGPILFGVLPLLIGAALKLYAPTDKRRMAAFGVAATSVFCLAAFAVSGWPIDSTQAGLWTALYGAALVGSALLHRENPTRNLLIAWALAGLAAPYFPALFQRKLTMMLAIPLAILAAIGLSQAVSLGEKSKRSVAIAVILVLCSTSSLLWFRRELTLLRSNVSNTTRHPVFLTSNVASVVKALDKIPAPKIVLAMPGVASKSESMGFDTPLIPDLAPILTGLAGATSYAGHWSETPNYGRRAGDATEIFLNRISDAERRARLIEWKIQYVVAPNPETYVNLPLADLTGLGDVIVDGPQFRLIRLRLASE